MVIAVMMFALAACVGDGAHPRQVEGNASLRACTEAGGRWVTVILNTDELVATRDANLKVGPDEPLLPLPALITAAVIRCEFPEPASPITRVTTS